MTGQVKLPIELACALAAGEMQLPVPRGVVILAERDQLPGLPAAAKPINGRDFLCFGSLHQWPDDSITRLMDDESAEEFVWQQLCKRPIAAKGAAWDELAANPDRHIRNLIFDGDEYWFIDHELALEPVAKVMRHWAVQSARQGLIDFRAKKNVVASQLVDRQPVSHGMREQSASLARAQRKIELVAEKVRTWRTGVEPIDGLWPIVEVALRGIALRLPALPLMMDERLHVPDKTLLWNSSSIPPA